MFSAPQFWGKLSGMTNIRQQRGKKAFQEHIACQVDHSSVSIKYPALKSHSLWRIGVALFDPEKC